MSDPRIKTAKGPTILLRSQGVSAPLAPFVAPTPADLSLAASIVDSHPVVSAYAAVEWDSLDENGQIWIAAIVREAMRQPRPCTQCNGFGYFLMAPSTCQAGGERVPCGSCSPQVIGTIISGIADDYMTSARHHPGYVLIPAAKFDQLRDAEMRAQQSIADRANYSAPEAWGDRECSGCTLPRRDCECN